MYIHAATGAYRGGKSTTQTLNLRSLLPAHLQQTCVPSFSVAAGVNGHTRGIWVWAAKRKFLSLEPSAGSIVLLDMEGLLDTKGSEQVVSDLFTLSALLSSSLTMHVQNVLDTSVLKHLMALTSSAKRISGKLSLTNEEFSKEASQDFINNEGMLAKTFTFLVRDGQNYFYNDTREMYQYDDKMESVLVEDLIQDETVRSIVRIIKAMFPERHLFACEHATSEEIDFFNQFDLLPGIPNLKESPFTRSYLKVQESLFKNLKPKRIGSDLLSGTALAYLARSLLEVINSDSEIPLAAKMNPDSLFDFVCRENSRKALTSLNSVLKVIGYTLPQPKEFLDLQINQVIKTDVLPILYAAKSDMGAAVKYEQCLEDFLILINSSVMHLIERNSYLNSYEWIASEWEDCIGRCPGHRSRSVYCKRNDNTTVSDSKCDSAARPSSTEVCSINAYSWIVQGTWSDCEGICPGKKTRTVYCGDCSGNPVDSANCANLPKDADTKTCDLYTTKETYDAWSACSAVGLCAVGHQERTVRLIRCDQIELNSRREVIGCSNQCPPPQISCISANSIALLENGTEVLASRLHPGMRVWAFDVNSKAAQVVPVLFVKLREASAMRTVVLSTGQVCFSKRLLSTSLQRFTATPSHILYSPEGSIHLQDLQVGSKVLYFSRYNHR